MLNGIKTMYYLKVVINLLRNIIEDNLDIKIFKVDCKFLEIFIDFK